MTERYRRRSIRLPGYDYAQQGAYFVTICVHNRECLFGGIEDDTMNLNPYGQLAHDCWQNIPAHFPCATLDAFVIMPNHIHGLIVIAQETNAHPAVGAQHAAPLPTPRPQHNPSPAPNVAPGSLGAIVRSYKSAVTRSINAHRHMPGAKVWQRNYYEHIIRDEKGLSAIRAYIEANPANWQHDSENPAYPDRQTGR
jgi:putative transposase